MSDASPVFEAWDPRYDSPAMRRQTVQGTAAALAFAALVWGGGEQGLAAIAMCMALLHVLLSLRGRRRSLRIDRSGVHRRAADWPRLLPWEIVTEVHYDPRTRQVVFMTTRRPRALALHLKSYDGEELPRAVEAIAAYIGDVLREHVEGSRPTGEDTMPWPADTTLGRQESGATKAWILMMALSLAWTVYYPLRHYSWAPLTSAAVLTFLARWAWVARMRVHVEGVETWSLLRSRTRRLLWSEISGFDGGDTSRLAIRLRGGRTLRTHVFLSPGHFTRLQATQRQHGVEAVFA